EGKDHGKTFKHDDGITTVHLCGEMAGDCKLRCLHIDAVVEWAGDLEYEVDSGIPGTGSGSCSARVCMAAGHLFLHSRRLVSPALQYADAVDVWIPIRNGLGAAAVP